MEETSNNNLVIDGANDETSLNRAFNILNNLLNIDSKFRTEMLADFDTYMVGNPNFYPDRIATFRRSLESYWELVDKPIEGIQKTVTLKVAFTHPVLKARTEKLRKIFADEIRPVIIETQAKIREILQR